MPKPRIPPHPTTKQGILFLRRMGFPAQKKKDEFGHYVDYTKGDVSLKSEFKNIYESSSETFADTFGIDTEGYDQSEFFADGFAKYYSGYSHQMEKEYPELCRYIKAAISKDNVSRKSV